MEEQVIQIQAQKFADGEALVVLTNLGRVFAREFPGDHHKWTPIDLPNFKVI